jgi:hypothetical protein
VAAPAQRAAPARTADGKPDLNGIWQTLGSAHLDILDHSAAIGVPAGPSVVEGGELPYQPWAAAKKHEHDKKRQALDPLSKCYMPGVPRAIYMPFPFQIAQTPDHIGMAFEFVHATRMIYMDGSKHPEGAIDFWMGDSRGTWDGDTLVVDVANLNEQTWFDAAGNFHSDALHVVERFTPVGADHLRYDATIEDPKVFTRPWTMSVVLYRRMEKNVELLEYECAALLEQKSKRPGGPR